MTTGEWFKELFEQSVEFIDYSQADANKLISDYLWARRELDRLKQQTEWVGELIKDPRVQADKVKLQQCLDFFVKHAWPLAACFGAFITKSVWEANARINRNQINRHFGLLKLSIYMRHSDLQNHALKNLHELAIGIAVVNDWTHPEGIEGWKGLANLAINQQLRYFQDLDVWGTFEKMIENKFAVVGSAIKNRFIDEFRRQYRRPLAISLDEDVVQNLPAVPEVSPEEEETAEAFERLLSAPPADMPEGQKMILAAAVRMLEEGQLDDMSIPKIRARLVNEAASMRVVSPQQARKDMKRLERQKDAIFTRIQDANTGSE